MNEDNKMEGRFHIKLEAKNPEKGNFRSYAIDAEQGLFGYWKVAD